MAKIVVYEVWVPAWDSLLAISRHLHRIKELGVDYVWLSGALQSPGYDHGYDVSDYKLINPKYGTVREFDAFVRMAHSLGLKVLLDLVLNHTSTEHKWFKTRPERYCWRKGGLPMWESLFGGSAWKYDVDKEMFYLHLFHQKQADLDWFPNGTLDEELVSEFKDVVEFWTKDHHVDGFRLDVPQALNKDFGNPFLDLSALVCGDQSKALAVINAIFPNKWDKPFLMMECFDPTFGKVVNTYANATNVDFVMNVSIKDKIHDGVSVFQKFLKTSVLNSKKLMIDLESHDSPRFSSGHFSPEWWLKCMLDPMVEGVCIYQGQELGLKNPTKDQLSNQQMLRLDAQTEMLFRKELARFDAPEAEQILDSLRASSRANARVPFKVYLEEYAKQEKDQNSCLNWLKITIQEWERR